MEKSIDKTANSPAVDTSLKRCVEGSKIGIENITPVIILGYMSVYVLQATGLMISLECILVSIMGMFGLLGEAFVVLISTFFAKAPGCATAATMHVDGELALR